MKVHLGGKNHWTQYDDLRKVAAWMVALAEVYEKIEEAIEKKEIAGEIYFELDGDHESSNYYMEVSREAITDVLQLLLDLGLGESQDIDILPEEDDYNDEYILMYPFKDKFHYHIYMYTEEGEYWTPEDRKKEDNETAAD